MNLLTHIVKSDKSVGECVVSLHQFDDKYQTDYEVTSIDDVPELNASNYIPRGMTALLDAIGKTINELGESLENIPEDDRPDTVIVAILTDGYENASEEYRLKDIKKLIIHQCEVYNWEFIFLGAGQDAIATAAQLSIEQDNAMTYTANDQGTRAAFRSMSAGINRKRMSKRHVYEKGGDYKAAIRASHNTETFTDQDRKEQEDADI